MFKVVIKNFTGFTKTGYIENKYFLNVHFVFINTQ